MSEVSSEPPIHELFTQPEFDNLKIPELSEQQLRELSLDQIQGILRGSLGRQYKAAEGDPELQRVIKSVPLIAFGSLLYKSERFASTEDPIQKEANARLQHVLAHSIHFAGLPSAENTFSETVYGMVKTLETLYSRSETELDNPKIWWKGVKVELAVIKALKANNFKVFLPNYGGGSQEVMLLDVMSGIDLMALPPSFDANTIFAIDAKSGAKAHRRSFTDLRVLDDTALNSWPGFVKEKLLGKTDRRVVAGTVEVYVPSQMAFSPLLDLENPKESLRNYGHLHQDEENGIIKPLLQLSK